MSNIFSGKDDEEVYSPQQKISLQPFIRVIKRKAWLIAIITALGAAAYVYWDKKQNSTSQYEGDFQLLVEPLTFEARLSEPTTLTDSKGVPNEKLLAVDYPTLIKILTSRDILANIAEGVRDKYPNFSIDRLAKNFTVKRVGETRIDESKIIAISYSEENPELVQLVLQEAAEEYLDYSLETRIQAIGTGLEFIEQQLPELNQKVARNRNELQELQERYQMVEAETKGKTLLETVGQIEQEQITTEKEIAQQTRIRNNLRSKLNISVDEAIAISALRENNNYQNLLEQLKDKERELAVASATFYANSPQAIALQEEKQELLDLLEAQTRQVLAQEGLSARISKFLVANNQDSILLGLVEQLVEAENQLELLQARQQALTRNANSFEAQLQQFPEVSRQYQELQKELEIANRTREQLLIQKDRLQIQASQTNTPWSIVSEPQLITDEFGNPVPVSEDSNMRIVKGLVGGLLLGIVTAILLDRRSNRFYDLDDVTDITDPTPVLGDIPFNPNLLETKDRNLVKTWFDLPAQYIPSAGGSDSQHSVFLDAFDRLYANLYLRYRSNSLRSLAICSPSKGDGRSTIALYLARQIAARGKKVLLIDASSFSYQLPDRLVSATQAGENFYVLIASQALLENSVQREKLMSEFKAKYDYVIYDTPPLLDSVTASLLAVDTDGVLLVAAIDRTNRALFKKAYEQIETFKIPLLGVVTNHAGSETSEDSHSLGSIEQNRFFQSNEDNTLEAQTDRQSEDESVNKPKSIKPSNKR